MFCTVQVLVFSNSSLKIETDTPDNPNACPSGVVQAVKDHTTNSHFTDHHDRGMTKINYCVEVEDFDYVGDGYLGWIVESIVLYFSTLF